MSSILVKSLIDTFITAICYYCVGYALTIGKGSHVNRESRDVETGLWGTGMGTHKYINALPVLFTFCSVHRDY